jgi:DNA-binding CsgD family transcriptional regulator
MIPRTTVTERDFRTMLSIVTRPHDMDDDTDPANPLPSSVLTELQRLIPCDNVSFYLQDSYRRESVFDQYVGELGSVADEDLEGLNEVIWTHYWNCPPCHYPDSSGDLNSITTISDFYSDRQLHSDGMYCDYFKLVGVERALGVCLPGRPGRVPQVCLFRGPGMDFSPRDRGLLALLRPHLDNIYRERRRRHPTTPQLTARQQQLLRMVASGATNGQIARRLSITEATVRKHLEHIFQRLQVNSRTAAVTRYSQEWAAPGTSSAEVIR